MTTISGSADLIVRSRAGLYHRARTCSMRGVLCGGMPKSSTLLMPRAKSCGASANSIELEALDARHRLDWSGIARAFGDEERRTSCSTWTRCSRTSARTTSLRRSRLGRSAIIAALPMASRIFKLGELLPSASASPRRDGALEAFAADAAPSRDVGAVRRPSVRPRSAA